MPDKKILVVEDEPDVRGAFQSFLGRRGYQVSATASGAQALKMIAAMKPDLVFLDVSLDGMSGIEMLKELRKNDPFTKVVVLTGQLSGSEDAQEITGLGVIDVLHKPISLSRLEELVVRILAGKDPVGASSVPPAASVPEALVPDIHKVSNLLGVIRNSCEAFILDADEGFHKDKSALEVEQGSLRVMRGIIENVDKVSGYLARLELTDQRDLEGNDGR